MQMMCSLVKEREFSFHMTMFMRTDIKRRVRSHKTGTMT